MREFPFSQANNLRAVHDLSFQEVSLLIHLVEILMFLTRQHLFRSKYFIFSEGLAARIAQLLTCPQKHLKLSKSKSRRGLRAGED